MGSPRRLRKLFDKPKKVWDSKRLEVERKLLSEYGLKNMRELWRTQTTLRKVRREARHLMAARGLGIEGKTQKIVDSVKRTLIKKELVSLDDILALDIRDILERRLQTVILRKGMAHTTVQARQFITHGHICVKGAKCTAPSRIVSFDEEAQITWHGKPVSQSEAESKPKAEASKAKVEAAPAAA